MCKSVIRSAVLFLMITLLLTGCGASDPPAGPVIEEKPETKPAGGVEKGPILEAPPGTPIKK